MEKYKVKYDSVLGKLFNNLNIHHLADSVNGYVATCDEHTINQVASARAFLFLERFCGKDGRVRAFNQIMGDNGITNYNVDLEDTNYFKIHYGSSIGFSLKDNLPSDKPNKFIINFWHPYKQKFNHKNIDNCELTKFGSNDVLLERTKYLNDMRLAA
jgi:hypothetical protein